MKSERDVALERVTTLATALSAAVDRKLASYVGNLETLAGALHVDASDLPRFMAVARAGSQSLKGSLVLLDRSGQQHINTAAVADIVLPMTADPKAVQRVFETAKPHISDLVSGTVHQRFIFSVRVPLIVNEEIRYALGYVPEFGQRFGDRRQSLAQSHDLLVERNWSGTFVHDLVKAQLRSFVDENDPRLELSGDPILLSPTAAQHIGLALHELATNATKYGAWS